ncbi:MAG TPA: DUF72 domain-containing protein [Polyangiales bacterium]|nr:DUF72 domain-containing protein [Polyangiales bacterium]
MLHIGALLDRAPGRKYLAALRFAELALRNPLPRAGTLASMRKGLPDNFVLALRAPRSAVVSARGPLREDAELSASVAWMNEAANALQARAVIIHTPSELTPGARSRDLLRAYAAQLPRVPDRHYVWAAQGAWEPEEAEALCKELGLVRAFDPLETPPSSASEVVYATLRALGHRAGFSYSALADAVTRTVQHGPRDAFISVDAERSFDVAKRLQTLANEGLRESQAPLTAGGEDYDEDSDSDDDEDSDDDQDDDSDKG